MAHRAVGCPNSLAVEEGRREVEQVEAERVDGEVVVLLSGGTEWRRKG